MRAPASIVTALAILVALTPVNARAERVDVVVGAGHEGRPQSCAPLAVRACNLGTGLGNEHERDWTPIVANATADALRAAGLRVQRRPADYVEHDSARAAVFLHFDGSAPACRSGASVGYPLTTEPAFARAWTAYYQAIFPFRFAGENITRNEAQYYGYRKVTTPGRTMLIEFGEMTCPAQERWLAPRLHQLGEDVAHFLIKALRP